MSTTPTPQYWAVIPAAGTGVRMRAGRPKQYLKLRGRCVLEYSAHLLMDAPWIEGVVIVLQEGDDDFPKLALGRHWKIHTATGGSKRADSVLAGLARVAELAKGAAPYVLVHDAARPCLTRNDLERLRDEATSEHGGLLAVPMADTVKRGEGPHSASTVNRRDLWRAQTPQLFRLDLLQAAMTDALSRGVEMTDEAAAMEAFGHRPRLVQGSESNLKVTVPDDLALAEFWLARQENGR
ncbi:MAG TPA: 2-C-methyl-D-erythritol 4-phosphate cytidylyltransferase [Verrucomicrobiae bacterium]|nr:2-C-methyl-D-erythritol 4-phosphate cytidylyltransferase [Verrucomicrobiae bacterium]